MKDFMLFFLQGMLMFAVGWLVVALAFCLI